MITRPTSLLLIGHACHDVKESTFVPGGTVTYAALMAKKIGNDVALLTSVGQDYQYMSLLEACCDWLKVIPANHTTCFLNKETNGGRLQYISQKAADITLQSVSLPDFTPDIVLFGPIANEIDTKTLSLFSDSLKVACIQGWLRHWGEDGKVFTTAMDASALQGLDVVIASNEDLSHWDNAIHEILAWVPLLVVTAGVEGATLYSEKEVLFLPSYPVSAKETTGAGYIFALGFSIEYQCTKDPEKSAIYAHAMASCHIEGDGLMDLPGLQDISLRCEQYQCFYDEYRSHQADSNLRKNGA